MGSDLTRQPAASCWPWRVYATFLPLAAVAFLVGGPGVRSVAFVAANAALWLAVAVRVRRSEPAPTDPWRMFLAAYTVYLLADSAWYLLPAAGHRLAVPSPVDGAFFAAYLMFGLALGRMSRRYTAQAPRAGLEVVIFALGLSAPIWELWLRPTSTTGSTATDLTLVAYPAIQLVVFGLALRVLVLSSRRELRWLLLLGWAAGELAGDLYLAASGTAGMFSASSPWLLWFFLSWLCLGVAALRPQTTPPVTATPAREPSARRRLVALSAAALLPTATLFLVELRSQRLATYAGVASFAVLVLLLVRASALLVDLDAEQRQRLDMDRLNQRLRHESLHDPLTGLANRTLVYDRIEHALQQRVAAPGSGVAVLWLDLDGFKAVNDTVGHDAGDRVLLEVARRLLSMARVGDTVARLGGDEFALVLPAVDAGEAAGVAERVSRALSVPVDLGSIMVPPTGSMGVALSDGSQDRETLLKHADLAMYAAKLHAPGGYRVFSADLHAASLRRGELSTAIRGAAARGELYLDYQPVMELTADRMTGVEALVRWRHPTLGLLPPLSWIPLAEANGSIAEVGAWVLEQACRQLNSWDAQHPHQRLDIAVNVSPRQLDQHDIVPRLRQVLQRTGVDPGRVVLEVTESALSVDPELAVQRLEQLKTLGCLIAIDDFGTGFSSLSFLRRLPVDLIKIDKAFVDGIAKDAQEWAFTTAIVALATSLGKRVVAEGIEHGEQLAHLMALHCQYGQGYLFSRPVSPELISALLTEAAPMASPPARSRTSASR